MGIIVDTAELQEIAKDNNLRCDPLHIINYDKFEKVFDELNFETETVADIVESISNGINFPASMYSLNPTSNIYISVKEFGNGIQLIKTQTGDIRESVTFLRDEVVESENYEAGLIKTNEIIIARSGAIGKVAWLGDFIELNDELNLVASGFTTKLKIKEGYDCRFVNLWLNQPFIKHFLIAKSAGKCQRNISQDYLYLIPFPRISHANQIEIAEKFYSDFIEFETGIENVGSTSKLVDKILEVIFKIDLHFEVENGLKYSSTSLSEISDKYSLRCDAKQNIDYLKRINEIFRSIPLKKMGDYFTREFIKGKQPNYLNDQESEGIPIISTLAIQDHSINIYNCKKVSTEYFLEYEESLKPRIGDILITLDGAVSVGKPVYFDLDEEFGVDSHIGIVRLDNPENARLISFLLGSRLCNAQFRMFESGATSMSINEIDLREIKIPFLSEIQKDLFFSLLADETQKRNELIQTIDQKRSQRNLLFLGEIVKVINL